MSLPLRVFPWVLKVLDLPGIHFYKVIELMIRAEPALSRQIVHHLNTVSPFSFLSPQPLLEGPSWKTFRPPPPIPLGRKR